MDRQDGALSQTMLVIGTDGIVLKKITDQLFECTTNDVSSFVLNLKCY